MGLYVDVPYANKMPWFLLVLALTLRQVGSSIPRLVISNPSFYICLFYARCDKTALLIYKPPHFLYFHSVYENLFILILYMKISEIYLGKVSLFRQGFCRADLLSDTLISIFVSLST